jgi:hypothetical protein
MTKQHDTLATASRRSLTSEHSRANADVLEGRVVDGLAEQGIAAQR